MIAAAAGCPGDLGLVVAAGQGLMVAAVVEVAVEGPAVVVAVAVVEPAAAVELAAAAEPAAVVAVSGSSSCSD